MGNEEHTPEKASIVEFIYKDASLIDSFYAQIFEGNLSRITKSSTSSESSKGSIRGGIKILEGETGSEQTDTDNQTSDIDPHDAKIADLIHEIIHDDWTNSFENGNLVQLSGKIRFVDKSVINKNIDAMNEIGALDSLYSVKTDLKKRYKKGNTVDVSMEKLIEVLIKLIPEESYCFINYSDMSIKCPLKPEYMQTKASSLIESFGTNLPDDFVIIGIYNKILRKSIQDIEAIASSKNFSESILAFQDAPSAVDYFLSFDHLVKPLVIYRHVNY